MTPDDPNFAFPTHPVKIVRTGVPSSLLAYIVAVFLLLLAVVFVRAESPGVWQDWQIRKDPVPVEDASIRDAVCKERYVLFHTCSAHVDYVVAGRPYRQSLSFSFVTFHTGNWDVEVVRSRSHPEMAAFDLGLDMIWNRMAVLLLFPLALLGLAGRAVLLGRRHGVTRATEGMALALLPLKADIKTETGKKARKQIAFSCDIDGKTRHFVSIFRKDEEPFGLGEGAALAVWSPGVLPPILLDKALRRVDLTCAERDSLRGQLEDRPA